MVEQLVLTGAPIEMIEQARSEAEADEVVRDFEIWPDCLDSFNFFLSLRGQWAHVSGMTTARTGLPSTRVQAHMDLQGIRHRKRPQLFKDINAMEEAVLVVDRELAAKRQAEKGD